MSGGTFFTLTPVKYWWTKSGPPVQYIGRPKVDPQSSILADQKWTHPSIKLFKNEEGCRDNTVPKAVDRRRPCEVYRSESMQQSSVTPSLHLFFGVGCEKLLHTLTSTLQGLLDRSCINSFWHGFIPTSFFIFTLVPFNRYT